MTSQKEDQEHGSLDININYTKIAKELQELEHCVCKARQYFLIAEDCMEKIKNFLELAVLKRED